MIRIRRYARRGIQINNGAKQDIPRISLKACLPSTAIIPLLQHEGPEAILCVALGDYVAEGSLIGRAPPGGVAVHTSIPGRVQKILNWRLHDGRECQAVEIVLEGAFSFLTPNVSPQDWQALEDKQLLKGIEDAGLIHDGQGNKNLSERFTTYRALQSDALIISLMATLPGTGEALTLINENAAGIVMGIRIAVRLLAVNKVVIVTPPGLEKQAKDFFARLKEQVSGLIVLVLDNWYPNHLSEVLLPAVGSILPKKGQKFDAMILLPRTTLAIYEALVTAKPLIEQHVMLAGSCFSQSRLIKARIGTPLYQIIEDAGGLLSLPEKIIANNLMTGYPITSIESTLTKDMVSILAIGKAEAASGLSRECIRCGLCVQNCPVDFEPELLHRLIQNGKRDQARAIGLDRCIGCGLCAYICPSNIPLSQTFRVIQAECRTEESTQ